MLDRIALHALKPGFEAAAAQAVRLGWRADAVTLAGLALALAAAGAIAASWWTLGLVLMFASRLADGLDGAIARLTQPTDRGAFLDIACDFVFYAAIPLAFAWANPAANALAAATLLAAFIGTGTSFLAFAVLAERRGLKSEQYPRKGFFYLGGLTEATETLVCFALMCLRPDWFAALAFGFAALCALTLVTRLAAGWRMFSDGADRRP